MIEAQAALDLYLMDMRRREDQDAQNPRHASSCEKLGNIIYFKLDLLSKAPGASLAASRQTSQPHRSSENVFTISWKDLRNQLTTRGSMTDYFSHPFIHARTSLHWGRLIDSIDFSAALGSARTSNANADDISDQGSEQDTDLNSSSSDDVESGSCEDELAIGDRCDTLIESGLGRLGFDLIALTPGVQHLATSSAISGVLPSSSGNDTASICSLQTYSLGPRLTKSNSAFLTCLSDRRFLKLEKLRLCGLTTPDSAMWSLSNRERMPQLKEVQWDLSSAEHDFIK